MLIPIGFRTASCLRETSDRHALAPREGSFVRTSSIEIFHEELGSSDGDVVLLVHGTLAWSGTYRPLMERLAGAGYHAIAIDLPPFGFSERPQRQDYDRHAQAERIASALDAMHLERAVLVGHSFGGGATVEAAMSLGARVRGLVLLDAALGLGEPLREPPLPFRLDALRGLFVASTLTNPMMIGVGLREFVYDDALVTPDRIAIYEQPYAIRRTTDAVGRWVVTGLYADESRSRSGNEAAYQTFAAPTLLVWGREDSITPLEQGEHLSELLPNDQLVVLDRVGHIPHVESLDATAAALLSFLETLPR